MGTHTAITHDTFPAQGGLLNKACDVVFHYDTSKTIRGTIVRDDIEAPFQTIIRLNDGRFIRAEECQYSPDC